MLQAFGDPWQLGPAAIRFQRSVAGKPLFDLIERRRGFESGGSSPEVLHLRRGNSKALSAPAAPSPFFPQALQNGVDRVDREGGLQVCALGSLAGSLGGAQGASASGRREARPVRGTG